MLRYIIFGVLIQTIYSFKLADDAFSSAETHQNTYDSEYEGQPKSSGSPRGLPRERMSRGRENSGENSLPGRGQFLVDPQMDVRSAGMNFAFGSARRQQLETEGNPYVTVDAGGEKMKLPKGIYHYSNHDTGAELKWKLPENGQFLSGKAELLDNYRNIDGIYLRQPFVRPINVQVITERKFEHGLEGTAAEKVLAALQEAREICEHDEGIDCEDALNRYYKLRADEVIEENAPLHEQLVKLGDLAATAKVRSRNGNGLGLLLDLPFQEDPLYVGASLDKNDNNNMNVLFQAPRQTQETKNFLHL